MNKKILLSVFISIISCLSVKLNAQEVKPIYIVHVNLGNFQLSQTVIDELLRSNPEFENRPVKILRPNLDTINNSFAASPWGFQTGNSRENNEIRDDLTPVLKNTKLGWFEDLERQNIQPEIFIINGHHFVGLGFESDTSWPTDYKDEYGEKIVLPYSSIFFQTLVESSKKHNIIKKFFSNIKLVFIGGCEGLTNLEPKENGISGGALQPDEIFFKIHSGEKKLMLGDATKGTGLLGYKDELVSLYPGDFTENEEDEICIDPVKKLHCEVFNVNRILPESGLWDGSHVYNRAYVMKRMFPNALAIFGFFTPSPLKPGPIWKAAFNSARDKLKRNNLLQPLLSNTTSVETKKEIIQKLRIAWTSSTQRLNKKMRKGVLVNRISGSITPAYPDLDINGLFAYEPGQKEFPEAPAYAPYEVRNDSK